MHETAVIDGDVEIGEGTKIWHFSHVLSNSRIGERCNIGQNVVIGPDVDIGAGCKLQNNVSVFKGVTFEDGVFCGPSMVFTNIYNVCVSLGRDRKTFKVLVWVALAFGSFEAVYGLLQVLIPGGGDFMGPL